MGKDFFCFGDIGYKLVSVLVILLVLGVLLGIFLGGFGGLLDMDEESWVIVDLMEDEVIILVFGEIDYGIQDVVID